MRKVPQSGSYSVTEVLSSIAKTIITAFIVLVVAAFSSVLVRNCVRGEFDNVPRAEERVWSPQFLGDIMFDSPKRLFKTEVPTSQVSEDVLALTESITVFENFRTEPGLSLVASQITYKPGVAISTEGAVLGALLNTIKLLGHPDEGVNTKPVPLETMEAAFGFWRLPSSQHGPTIQAFALRRGQTIYLIQATYDDRSFSHEEFRRIFNSIRLK